jgi:hypothetical protein
MPLLKRKRFEPVKVPHYDDSKKESRNTVVWYSPLTKEIFKDYSYVPKTRVTDGATRQIEHARVYPLCLSSQIIHLFLSFFFKLVNISNVWDFTRSQFGNASPPASPT